MTATWMVEGLFSWRFRGQPPYAARDRQESITIVSELHPCLSLAAWRQSGEGEWREAVAVLLSSVVAPELGWSSVDRSWNFSYGIYQEDGGGHSLFSDPADWDEEDGGNGRDYLWLFKAFFFFGERYPLRGYRITHLGTVATL